MFNKKVSIILLLVVFVVLAMSVPSAFAADYANWQDDAPQCEVVDNAQSDYLVVCVDDDIVDVQVRSIGLDVVTKWTATKAFIEVTGESNSRVWMGPGDDLEINGILIWKVIDSAGHSTRGVYRS